MAPHEHFGNLNLSQQAARIGNACLERVHSLAKQPLSAKASPVLRGLVAAGGRRSACVLMVRGEDTTDTSKAGASVLLSGQFVNETRPTLPGDNDRIYSALGSHPHRPDVK